MPRGGWTQPGCDCSAPKSNGWAALAALVGIGAGFGIAIAANTNKTSTPASSTPKPVAPSQVSAGNGEGPRNVSNSGGSSQTGAASSATASGETGASAANSAAASSAPTTATNAAAPRNNTQILNDLKTAMGSYDKNHNTQRLADALVAAEDRVLDLQIQHGFTVGSTTTERTTRLTQLNDRTETAPGGQGTVTIKGKVSNAETARRTAQTTLTNLKGQTSGFTNRINGARSILDTAIIAKGYGNNTEAKAVINAQVAFDKADIDFQTAEQALLRANEKCTAAQHTTESAQNALSALQTDMPPETIPSEDGIDNISNPAFAARKNDIAIAEAKLRQAQQAEQSAKADVDTATETKGKKEGDKKTAEKVLRDAKTAVLNAGGDAEDILNNVSREREILNAAETNFADNARAINVAQYDLDAKTDAYKALKAEQDALTLQGQIDSGNRELTQGIDYNQGMANTRHTQAETQLSKASAHQTNVNNGRFVSHNTNEVNRHNANARQRLEQEASYQAVVDNARATQSHGRMPLDFQGLDGKTFRTNGVEYSIDGKPVTKQQYEEQLAVAKTAAGVNTEDTN